MKDHCEKQSSSPSCGGTWQWTQKQSWNSAVDVDIAKAITEDENSSLNVLSPAPGNEADFGSSGRGTQTSAMPANESLSSSADKP